MQAGIELPRPIAEILKEQFLGGSYLKLDVTALKTGRTKSTQDKDEGRLVLADARKAL